MFSIIGGDGKEYGPVSVAKIQEWISGGRANLQTRARRSNETEWRTLGDFPEFGAVPATPAAVIPPPAAIAPAAAPASTGPVPALVPPTVEQVAADAVARAAQFDLFSCISRSVSLWTANFGPLVGVTVLMCLIQFVAGLIPFLGLVSGLVLNGALIGGLYYYYLGKIRGEPREVGDLFAGFSRAFGPLTLANLIKTFITLAVVLPFAGAFAFALVGAILSARHGGTPVFPAISGLMFVGLCIGILIAWYLSLSWIFGFALIIDRGLGPWDALEASRRVVAKCWFRMLLLVIFAGILTMLGVILLFIGVFLTMPLYFGAVLYAYEDLCAARAAPAAQPASPPAVPLTPPAP